MKKKIIVIGYVIIFYIFYAVVVTPKLVLKGYWKNDGGNLADFISINDRVHLNFNCIYHDDKIKYIVLLCFPRYMIIVSPENWEFGWYVNKHN